MSRDAVRTIVCYSTTNHLCSTLVFISPQLLPYYLQYKLIPQVWDFDTPCPQCGHLYLIEERKRNLCCDYGAIFTRATFSRLQPLPPAVHNLCTERLNHMTNSCVYYNNAFCLGNFNYQPIMWLPVSVILFLLYACNSSVGATSVDNGRKNQGWENIVGDHAVKLNGKPLSQNFVTFYTSTDSMRSINSYTIQGVCTTTFHVLEVLVVFSILRSMPDTSNC